MSKLKKIIKDNPVLYKIAHIINVPVTWCVITIKRTPVYLKETKEAKIQIKKIISSKNKIFLCGIPNHNNLGDQAQAYCIRQWITDNYHDRQIVELKAWPFYNKKFQAILENKVNNNDMFIVQSGYCSTEKHYNHYMHRYLASKFQNNFILFMPQTVNFFNPKEGYKTGRIYAKHNKLMFLARDKKSFEYAKMYFKGTQIKLFPDIVTSLIGTMKFGQERNGVLICVRNDGEKLYSDKEIEILKKKIENMGVIAEITDTNSDASMQEMKTDFERVFFEKLLQFSKYKVVITDRYHGTIFSMITNTPVIVLSTNDHKVKTGTEWFKGIYDEAYYNADGIDDVINKLKCFLTMNTEIKNTPYFKKMYFDKLKEMFEMEITQCKH